MVGKAWLAGRMLALCALLSTTLMQCTGDEAADDGNQTGGSGGATGGSSPETGGAGSGNGGATGGTPTGGTNAGGTNTGGARPSGGEGGMPEAGAGGESQVMFFSVASRTEYLSPPPPACMGAFIDHGCDGPGNGSAGADTGSRVPLDCDVPDEVISFEAGDDRHCPFCAPPGEGDDERSCDEVTESYGDFLSDVVSASCANYCEADTECAAWEIVNACGDFVLSLRGSIDEEPISFAEEFAVTHCGVCGATPQLIYLRRANSDRIEGGAPAGSLLESYLPRCIERQCVLERDL